MSTPHDDQPARHQTHAHEAAHTELQNTPTEIQTQIKNIIHEASYNRNPITHRKLEDLEGSQLLKIRVQDYRALLHFNPPHLDLVLVDKRRTVYTKLELAERRAGIK